MLESNPQQEIIEDAVMPEFAHERLKPSRVDSQDEKDAMAIDIAGIYLKKAALAFAKELLSSPVIHNEDDQIAQVETVLRAARHMRRTSEHNGDPCHGPRQGDPGRGVG